MQFGLPSILGILQLKSLFIRWFGVELDQPLGRHDGTVQDVRYFAAPDDHGVFVTESKLTKICNSTPKKVVEEPEESSTFSMNYHTLNNESGVDNEEDASRDERSRSKSPRDQSSKGRPLRRSLSMQHRASKVYYKCCKN